MKTIASLSDQEKLLEEFRQHFLKTNGLASRTCAARIFYRPQNFGGALSKAMESSIPLSGCPAHDHRAADFGRQLESAACAPSFPSAMVAHLGVIRKSAISTASGSVSMPLLWSLEQWPDPLL